MAQMPGPGKAAIPKLLDLVLVLLFLNSKSYINPCLLEYGK